MHCVAKIGGVDKSYIDGNWRETYYIYYLASYKDAAEYHQEDSSQMWNLDDDGFREPLLFFFSRKHRVTQEATVGRILNP